ncbi:MAG: peptidylprolyl isomerase [Lentisphaerae bacterium]|nr:peptidylprolyl isomerase [Lentisphaerota bacterium]
MKMKIARGCRPTPPAAAPEPAVAAPAPTPEPAAAPTPQAPAAMPAPTELTVERPAPVAAVAVSNSPETVLVQVNDQAITQGDLDVEISKLARMMQSQGRSDDQFAMMLPAIRPQILDSLIVRSLLAGEFLKKKITAADGEINGEIERIKASLPKNRTLEELLKLNGVSDQVFRDDIAEQVKFGKLLNIGEPTDKELNEFYEENKSRLYEKPETIHARHILIGAKATNSPAEKAACKAKAETLRKQLVDAKGADFEKLAQENSDCPSKAEGGDLGEFGKGQMVPEFEAAAFSLKTNEISAVVETEFGYHVVQLLEHNGARTIPFAEVTNKIVAQLKGRKLQEKARPFIQDLRDKATITYQHGAEPLKPMMMPPFGGAAPTAKEPDESQADKEDVAPVPAERPADKDAAKEEPPKQ